MGSLTQVNDRNFKEEVLLATVPVVVDFWSAGCVPCKMMEPVLERVAIEFGDKLKVVKMDANENPKARAQYEVVNMPTLLFFKDGSPVNKAFGAQSEHKIKTIISTLLELK